MLWFNKKQIASSYSFVVELYAKEQHTEEQAPYEKYVITKFDAPSRTPQNGLATRDPVAHLDLKLTPEVAESLVPTLQRQVKGASLLPEHLAGGPDVQPEIFVEGRKYKITIEVIDA